MGDRKEEYIRILTEQIRCKKARNQVAREMLNHMEEQEEFYVSEGMTRDEAQAEAVKEMGDPVEAGAALDMVHRPQMVGGLLALMGILYAAGFLVSCFLQKNFTDATLLPGAGLHHIIYINRVYDHGRSLLCGLQQAGAVGKRADCAAGSDDSCRDCAAWSSGKRSDSIPSSAASGSALCEYQDAVLSVFSIIRRSPVRISGTGIFCGC